MEWPDLSPSKKDIRYPACDWGEKKSLSISGILRFAEEIIPSIFLEEPNLNFQLYYKPTPVDNACQESINKIN